MLAGCGATFVTMAWIDLNTQGRMAVMATALAGAGLAAGCVPSLRGAARGSGLFAVVMLATLLVILARYGKATFPWWLFAWLGAAAAGMGVAWIPALRRRPWTCALLAGSITLLITVPALIVATKIAPVLEFE
jgi:hypothetical protein